MSWIYFVNNKLSLQVYNPNRLLNIKFNYNLCGCVGVIEESYREIIKKYIFYKGTYSCLSEEVVDSWNILIYNNCVTFSLFDDIYKKPVDGFADDHHFKCCVSLD